MDGQKKRLSPKWKRQIRNLVLFSIVIIAVAAIFLAIRKSRNAFVRALSKDRALFFTPNILQVIIVAPAGFSFFQRHETVTRLINLSANALPEQAHNSPKLVAYWPNHPRFKLRTLLSAQKKQIAQSSIIEKAILVFCFERICREFVDLISPFLYHNNIDSPSGNLFVVFVA